MNILKTALESGNVFYTLSKILLILLIVSIILRKPLKKLNKRKIEKSLSYSISYSYIRLFVICLIIMLFVVTGWKIYEQRKEFLSDMNRIKSELQGRDSTEFLIAYYEKDTGKIYRLKEDVYWLAAGPLQSREGIGTIRDILKSQTIELVFYLDVNPYQITYDISPYTHNIFSLLFVLIGASCIGFLIFLLFGYIAGYSVLVPVKRMIDMTNLITADNMDRRVDSSQYKGELKELADTLNHMLNRIEKAYEDQKAFVSDASHELRTPIAAIKGYLDMLNRWGKNDQEILDESLETMIKETDNMKDLIEKLLFLARGDDNRFALHKEKVNLSDLFISLKKDLELNHGSRGITFEIEEDVIAICDENSIKQVMRILIENSLKYTDEHGNIKITLSTDDKSIYMSVLDDGIGMNKKELSKVFERFYRVDQSRTKKTGGTGLGLAIARIIVKQNSGYIKVRSKLHVGSEFIVVLPR